MKRNYLLVLIALLEAAVAFSQPAAPALKLQENAWHNPVLNNDFADPTVIRLPNGKYYAYATQGSFKGRFFNIQVASSNDMLHWRSEGDAMPQKPAWADQTDNFWAPHVLYDSSLHQFVLLYSSSSNDTSTGKCIGIAFSDNPVGPFKDKGSPLICGEGFVNIDPMGFIDPKTGRKLMYWGSGFQPIRVQELTADWQGFKPGSTAQPVVSPGKESTYTRLLEGAWIDVEDSLYYLYYSGDNCCGERAHYAVMVARSADALGPFQRMGETNGNGSSVVLEQDSNWLAPGHNSVFTDSTGHKWIAYHAINRKQPPVKNGPTKRVMLINRLEYRNGWPVILKQP